MARWLVFRRNKEKLFDHLLDIRGLKESEVGDDFELIHSPKLLPDIAKAVALIKKHLAVKSRVAIFGDYDADGTPGAAVLGILFDHLKMPHNIFIPTREAGYGLRNELIDQLDPTTKLLVTVDNGVRSVEEIAYAKSKGMDVIVLDHHLPGDELPKADALIDPYLEHSKYPFKGLCGCALAYKLVVALEDELPELNKNLSKWLLDLVAISTVADMMPLTGENRQLVRYGLKVMKKSRWPGVKALLAASKVDPQKLTATTLGFVLGPRLNASGRLGDNQPALDLLLTKDTQTAEKLAWEIERANVDRQSLVEKVYQEAREELFKQNAESDYFYLVKKTSWSTGVVGLVAGRLASSFNRPVIVASDMGEVIRGSGRSMPVYSLIDGLNASAAYLAKYGGHKMAAGITVESNKWDKFVETIKKHAKKNLTQADLEKLFFADAILDAEEISTKNVELFNSLAPFGQKNPAPKFILRAVDIVSLKTMGSRGEHLRIHGRFAGKDLEIVAFGMSEKFPRGEKVLDILGSLEINTWQNRQTIQLKLIDYQESKTIIEEIDKSSPLFSHLVD